MPQRIVQVDAFTSEPFKGNPAAVCVMDGPADEAWLQHVALEMNLSETAFLYREGDGYRLRWFTPKVEVALCGHATLASAHVLWEEAHLRPDEIARFHTLSGRLTAERHLDGWIELDFPAQPASPVAPPAGLEAALGVRAIHVGKSLHDYLVEVEHEAIVRGLQPDFAALRSLPVRGVMVTARGATGDFDFVSRFFGPAVGVDEDPVTGSAHCCLVPYWAERLGKDRFVAYQASPRGGMLRLRLGHDRVGIAGQAVTVLRGELLV